ncbi:MAG: O-methyltransferase [Bacteroidota bacterium]|nr:O-methyltransferase [Bacteroidota bacterium]
MEQQDDNLEDYILSHIGEEDPILAKLNRETHLKILYSRMLSGHLQGKILTMLSHMIRPKRILELGTFTGYSAICLAKGLQEDGKLTTIEHNDELEGMIRKYFAEAGMDHKIELFIGDIDQIVPNLSDSFDLVFLDADKRQYLNHYHLVFSKVNMGGYIIADNILWSGKVTETPSPSDDQTKGIIEFNDFIANDSRVEKVILPIRDGMTIIRKIRD